MLPNKRTLGLALLSWAIPFACGFLLYPLKRDNAALFNSLMNIVVIACAGLLVGIYFRQSAPSAKEGLWFGVVCLGTNLILDYPMFTYGPMKMSALQYCSEIGLGYLSYPIYGWFAGKLAERK